MASDFSITLKAPKGAGSGGAGKKSGMDQAMSSRKKAIEAETKAGTKPGTGSQSPVAVMDINKKLIESNKLLIKSIKDFENTVKKNAKMGGHGGGGGGGSVPDLVGGAGKKSGMDQAKSSRKKAIEAETKAGTKPGTGSQSPVEVMDINKKLIESNKLLIKSIKDFENTVKKNAKMGGHGGGGGGGGGGGSVPDLVGGAGAIGSSIPILGAGMAVTGFLAHKISQIGNAYLDKMAEQKGSAGTAGVRHGQGMYNAAEMGAGMKAYGMSSGKFSTDVSSDSMTGATDIGSIYGLGAEQVLGQAGTFARAGKDYSSMANTALGGGIQSELPTLMQAMSGQLEEAIKNGLDASALANNLDKDLTDLTMATANKSVDHALSIAKNAEQAKGGAAKGQISTAAEMMAWRTGQAKMVENFNSDEYIKQQKDLGTLDDTDIQKINAQKQKEGGKISKAGITEALGATGANYFNQQAVGNLNGVELAQGEYGQMGSLVDPKLKGSARMRAINQQAISIGGTQDQAGNLALSKMGKQSPDAVKGKNIADDLLKERNATGVAGVETMTRGKEDLLMEGGKKFAEATMLMETGLRNLALKSLPAVEVALEALINTANDAAKNGVVTAVGHAAGRAIGHNPLADAINDSAVGKAVNGTRPMKALSNFFSW